MIPAILAPIPDVFTPIAEILATIPHILPTIADTAVVQRITAILAPIADVLAAIPHVLPVITHVFAAVPPILTAVRPRGGIWTLSGLGQGVERGHQRQPQHENSNYCTHLQLPVRPPALRGEEAASAPSRRRHLVRQRANTAGRITLLGCWQGD